MGRNGRGRLGAVDVARANQIKAGGIPVKILNQPLKGLQFDDCSNAAVAKLRRDIDRPADDAAVGVVPIGHHAIISGWQFHAQAEGKISVGVRGWVQRPSIKDQAHIAQAAGGAAVPLMVILDQRKIVMLHWDGQSKTKPGTEGVGPGDVNRMDGVAAADVMELGLLLVSSKHMLGMKIAIGDVPLPIIRVQVLNALGAQA